MKSQQQHSLETEIPVQMMLAWSLATRLRRRLGQHWTISHWELQMYHGLVLTLPIDEGSNGGRPSIVITYDASIHVMAPGQAEELLIPNSWEEILHGRPLDSVQDEISAAIDHQVAGPQTGCGTVEHGREAESGVAYEIIAALLRYSFQQGLGLRCDSAFDDGYGPIPNLVEPYDVFVPVTMGDLAKFELNPSRFGNLHSPEHVGDWSFITSPGGPVCAIDPNHWIIFPDGVAWPLPELAQDDPWRVAVAVVRRAFPKHRSTVLCPATANSWVGPQHAFAAEVSPADLFAHESIGGRVTDQPLLGPLPVLPAKTRKSLEKATDIRIPNDALTLTWPVADRIAAALADQLGLPLERPVGNLEPPRLVVLWNESPNHAAWMIIVGDNETLKPDAVANVADVASHLGTAMVALVAGEQESGPPKGFGWTARRLI